MRRVTLFIAMSLDGYIADEQGGVDWLNGTDASSEDMNTYHAFIKEVDTIVMGHTTYHQIVNELSPDAWAYEDKMTYVITHQEYEEKHNIKFVIEDPCDLIKTLQQEQGKGIWICGGASIIQQLMQENLIDIYHITLIPILLGNGISLFHPMKKEIKLSLKNTIVYNRLTDVIYERILEKE